MDRIRQPIVVVLGHVDSGKCVAGDMRIELGDGSRVRARDLFASFSRRREYKVRNGRVFVVKGPRLKSLLSGGLSSMGASLAWELESERLFRVIAEGRWVETTPEHPFLIYKEGHFEYVKAEWIRRGDLLLIYSSGLALSRVDKVEEMRGSFKVYDFTIPRAHNFIANGFFVHNTTLLDRIRGTAVARREVGGITQHIGASFMPMDTLKSICGPLLGKLKAEVAIPGLLVIDTPGHEVFTNLRRRGGSAADIAILVVDAMKGFEPQTYESLEILMERKVPFVVSLNKIDLIHGWRNSGSIFVTEALKAQEEVVRIELDRRIYEVVGKLSRLGFNSEAFWRVKDFGREVAIVPVSAKSGEGIAELLTVLVGLTQQYMKGKFSISLGKARGVILEVKEEPGLGTTANVILFNGKLRVGDRVVIAKKEGVAVTRIRALLMPKPLDEMRDPRDRFTPVEEVTAAAGVKLAAPDLEGVLAGSPIYSYEEGALDEMRKELGSILISTQSLGIVLKADTLGSLEALTMMLKRKGVPIRIADLGPVSRSDVMEALAVKEKDRYLGVVLAFNVRLLQDVESEARAKGVNVFTNSIIYKLVEDYISWVREGKEREEERLFESIAPVCKFKVLEGYIFRRSRPAIFGIEILEGRLKQKAQVINSKGRRIGEIHQIQERGKSIKEALKEMQVAVSIQDAVVGRHLYEGDVLYTYLSDEEIGLLEDRFRERLSEGELKVLKEVERIKEWIKT